MTIKLDDQPEWTILAQDEYDSFGLGWRVTNELVEQNETDPSIAWNPLLDLQL